MKVSRNSMLTMHELGRRQENDEEYLIGRPDISDFIMLPNIAIEIIDYFAEGKTVADVEQIMEQNGIDVDVQDFAESLVNDWAFVYKVDGVVVNEIVNDNGHFHWISEKFAAFFFNKFTFTFYIMIFLAGLILCLVDTDIFPHYKDAIVFSSVTYSVVFASMVNWLVIFLHEFAHLLAAKSLGVKSRIGFSHRLVFPVVETDMSNIVLLPHKRRYRALVAGMAVNGTIFGIGAIFLFIGSHIVEFSPLFVDTIRIFNLFALLGIAFQFLFYLETDIYYILTTYFKCNNLIHNTRLWMRKITRRIDEAGVEELEYIDPHEKKIMKVYIWMYMIGFVWAVSIFAAVTMPAFITMLSMTIVKMSGNGFTSLAFWDGIIFIAVSSIPFCILFWSWFRTWRQNRRARNILSAEAS